jgi:hypothetical protein
MVEAVLDVVAPTSLHVKGDLSSPEDACFGNQPPVLSLDGLHCTRLRTLQVEDAVIDTILADLPVRDLELVVRMVPRLGPKAWATMCNILLVDLALPNRTASRGDGDFPSRGMTVQIWVDTQERKSDLLQRIMARAAEDMDAATLEDRMGRIRVDVSGT